MQNNSKKEELKEVLERLNQGEDVDKVKQEARELLDSIDARELSEAEQQLINEGLEETELRHLCAAHIEAMADELEALKAEVEPGHPLHTLIAEHEEILEMLDHLEQINRKLQKLETREAMDEDLLSELEHIAEHLIETEKHHQREEEALFPEVDELGVTGPTRIMRMEHDDMWPRKERLAELVDNLDEINFEDFKKEVKEITEYLVLTMRDHIYKENNILYPTAREMIEEEKWADIKEKCDQIGYCCFTPEE